MSVPSVQLHPVEPVHPPVAGTPWNAQSRAQDTPRGPEQQDRVIVSEQARTLARSSSTGKQLAPGEVELKLDFRKLRELATAQEPATGQP